jgi:hypothetical protein
MLKKNLLDWIVPTAETCLRALKKDPDEFTWSRIVKSVNKSDLGRSHPLLAMFLLPFKHAPRFWCDAESQGDIDRYI